MTNKDKYGERTVNEVVQIYRNDPMYLKLGFLYWLDLEARDTPDEDPKKDEARSAAADLGRKLGLAMLPLAGLAAGGKAPSVNVWVICNS